MSMRVDQRRQHGHVAQIDRPAGCVGAVPVISPFSTDTQPPRMGGATIGRIQAAR